MQTFLPRVLTLCPALSTLGLQKHSSKTQTCELDVTLPWQFRRDRRCLTGGRGNGGAKDPDKTGFLDPPCPPEFLPYREQKFHQGGHVRTSLKSQIRKRVFPLESLSSIYVTGVVQVRKCGHRQRKVVDKSDYNG